jgi:hypothetical protein
MPSQGKRLRLRAPKLTLDAGDLLGEAIHGSKSRADALKRYRAKGGRISDARWYGRTEKGRGKQGRPEHSSVYAEAKLRGLDDRDHFVGKDDPSWRGIPRAHEWEQRKVPPYVYTEFEQFVEITGEEMTPYKDRKGRKRTKGSGVIITIPREMRISKKHPNPKKRKLKSKPWVERTLLQEYLEVPDEVRAKTESLAIKVIAVRYSRTLQNIKRPR